MRSPSSRYTTADQYETDCSGNIRLESMFKCILPSWGYVTSRWPHLVQVVLGCHIYLSLQSTSIPAMNYEFRFKAVYMHVNSGPQAWYIVCVPP